MAEPAHTTSTAHTEGGHGAFPPFQSQTFASQLVWLAIAFVLLYVLMAKLALPRVGAIIEGRQKHIEDDIAEAGRLKDQVRRGGRPPTRRRWPTPAAARRRSPTRRATGRPRKRIPVARRLEDELNVKLADAEKTIAATKQAAMSNVRGIAEDAARAIVERLIGSAPTDKAVTDAVADVLKR